MKTLITLTVFLLTLPWSSLSLATKDWQNEKDSNGVKMYSKKVAGYPIRFFKGEVIVQAPLKDVVSFISNTPNLVNWIPNVKSAELIEKVDDNSWISYQIFEPPFLKNRDIVLRAQITQDPKTFITVININTQANVIPEKTDFVRINKLRSKWTFAPIGSDKTKVEYEGNYDPEVPIPLFLLNFFIVDHPYQTLNKLKSLDFSKADKKNEFYNVIKNPE